MIGVDEEPVDVAQDRRFTTERLDVEQRAAVVGDEQIA